MVVGQVQVRDAVPVQCRKPFRFTPEDEAFVHPFSDCSDRTLQVGDDIVGSKEQRVDGGCEETVHPHLRDSLPDPSVQQQIACNNNVQGVARKALQRFPGPVCLGAGSAERG